MSYAYLKRRKAMKKLKIDFPGEWDRIVALKEMKTKDRRNAIVTILDRCFHKSFASEVGVGRREVARLLRFSPRDISVLVKLGRLALAPSSGSNGKMNFSRVEVEKAANDPHWVATARKAVTHFQSDKIAKQATRIQAA